MTRHSLLSIGDLAPDYTLPCNNDGSFGPQNANGKQVLLFFYPKDDTPGCTTEALDFTRLQGAFLAAGVIVVGISKDSLTKHAKFTAKFGLSVPLLSDAEGDVCERYGVWQEKLNFGKKYMGIVRTTYLIDQSGHIAQVWAKVKAKGHAQAVLTSLEQTT